MHDCPFCFLKSPFTFLPLKRERNYILAVSISGLAGRIVQAPSRFITHTSPNDWLKKSKCMVFQAVVQLNSLSSCICINAKVKMLLFLFLLPAPYQARTPPKLLPLFYSLLSYPLFSLFVVSSVDSANANTKRTEAHPAVLIVLHRSRLHNAVSSCRGKQDQLKQQWSTQTQRPRVMQ